MIELSQTNLHIARHAARLFLAKGVAATSGEDIAQAAGLSKRTVWRHFRTKEHCVAPLFLQSALQFAAQFDVWPFDMPIEAHLRACLSYDGKDAVALQDDILVARLMTILAREPELNGIWLLCCQMGEAGLGRAIAARQRRAPDDFEVRLCAASVSAAIRMVDETLAIAAIVHGEQFTTTDIVDHLSRAMRAAGTLPFCDAVAPNAFGNFSGGATRPALRKTKT